MESPRVGLMLDLSILIEVERAGATVLDLLEGIADRYSGVDVVISAITLAEITHGIYRAKTQEVRNRRREFVDELKQHVPIYAVAAKTEELMGRIGGESESRGTRILFADLAIGAVAVEFGYGVITRNVRHFRMIPGLEVRDFALSNT